MTLYATSDIHFFHKSSLKFCATSRPFSDVDEMNEAIVSNHNSMVSPQDTTYILGDITFGRVGPTIDLLNQMNGNKILIIGNHDKDALRKDKFRECFESIHDYVSLKYKGHDIYMFHYPIASWNKKHYGSMHLHGHLHGNTSGIDGRIKDVGMDTNFCKPYCMDDIVDEMLKIELPPSHHVDI